jgi:hypothetical protein
MYLYFHLAFYGANRTNPMFNNDRNYLLVVVTWLILFVFHYQQRRCLFGKEKQILAMESIIQGHELERSRMAKDCTMD